MWEKQTVFDSLSLPVALTKDRTPAEVIKLFQLLGSDAANSSGGPPQYSPRYRRRHSLSLQRRLSLGSIPEGQMVTTYSNESMESSLDRQSGAKLSFMEHGSREVEVWSREKEEDEEEKERKHRY